MSTDGIDVSVFQKPTPSLTGKAFLFARATYGTFGDAMYSTHIANARKAGKVAGAYHFGRAGNVPGQVAAFLARAGDADLFCLDKEKDGAVSMSDAEGRAFIAAVQATGRKIGLYHSESGFVDLGQDWNWVANWSQIPATHWTFHQYRGSPLDLDRFNGTLAQLQALVHPQKPSIWRAHLNVNHTKQWFTLYHVKENPNGGGHVTGTRVATTFGFTVNCKAPADFTFTGHATQRLVVLTSGSLKAKAKALGISVAVRAVYGRES